MKASLTVLLLFISLSVSAQTDTLPAAVYPWSKAAVQKVKGQENRQIARGSTRDLDELNVYAITLEKDKTLTSGPQEKGLEKLVIVKSGTLVLKTGDTVKTIGARSLALVTAGEMYSCQNAGAGPVVFYVLTYRPKTATGTQNNGRAGTVLVKEWHALPVKTSDKGAYRSFFDRPSALLSQFEVHATQLNPGYASHAPHTHRAEEIILLIQGKVQMQIDSGFHNAETGDLVFLESNVPHAAKNISNEPVEYYAIQWLP